MSAPQQQTIEKMEEAKKSVRLWVMLVYGAGVVFAMAFNEALMLSVFSGNDVLKYVAGAAVILIASNALLFPQALHNWAVSGKHRGWTIAFYVLDITFLAVNTVVSFGNLRGAIPGWAQWYMPYAPASMVIQGVASWAVIMILDPGEKSKVQLAEAYQSAELKIIKLMVEWLESEEGKGTLAEAAGVAVGGLFNVPNLSGKKIGVKAVNSGNGSDNVMDTIFANMPADLKEKLTGLDAADKASVINTKTPDWLVAGLARLGVFNQKDNNDYPGNHNHPS